MNWKTRLLVYFTDGDQGASMVEYALLVVLIAVIALVAVIVAGENVSEQFSNIASNIEGANS